MRSSRRAEEERFSRRKHGKQPDPFAVWELPELAAQWCLRAAGLDPDAVRFAPDHVAPMIPLDRAGEVFDGPLPSPAGRPGRRRWPGTGWAASSTTGTDRSRR